MSALVSFPLSGCTGIRKTAVFAYSFLEKRKNGNTNTRPSTCSWKRKRLRHSRDAFIVCSFHCFYNFVSFFAPFSADMVTTCTRKKEKNTVRGPPKFTTPQESRFADTSLVMTSWYLDFENSIFFRSSLLYYVYENNSRVSAFIRRRAKRSMSEWR